MANINVKEENGGWIIETSEVVERVYYVKGAATEAEARKIVEDSVGNLSEAKQIVHHEVVSEYDDLKTTDAQECAAFAWETK